ncbi:MAG: hypothetical protein KatS3mg131_2940 [Candidatus Tectimicrobiota bacterium]|nr:MAG: hypothetical protein KatS3mg131_2940 [Candidatus Tectomicrobia bacterium]
MQARLYVVLVLCAAMLLGGALLYLWPQMQLVALNYRRSQLQAEREAVLRRREELRVERATLRQWSRIEALAKERLGLRQPEASQVIYVRAEPRLPQEREAP